MFSIYPAQAGLARRRCLLVERRSGAIAVGHDHGRRQPDAA